MFKIRLTKNELKRQKDALRMYNRYLPTLILKKQQLQMEVRKVEERQYKLQQAKDLLEEDFRSWIAVFGEDVGLSEKLIVLEKFSRGIGNIAGVSIPLFEGAKFAEAEYDLWVMPLWVDKAIEELQRVMLLDLELQVLREQYSLLFAELRTTTQRVNLFEKVKIPETKMYIKKISIYLGDQQTASVVRGKIAKRGLEKALR
ncbi:V-type ATP synthase subunit D [Olavius algarvensis spirochete endosymbiont]|uniref:V-type ATP synthase subunit D n=1 Tax=Olavius algarvensis spirochete endosymbiont TaxID=260710 RepID=UPI000F16DE27|nr:V-type ATP synthase subunit D [Olavius algarvensis spirochete endosymbiont]VDB01020.1 V-type ATP synthase subunit D [Olavius algarvensis spirochete endosymbiont]